MIWGFNESRRLYNKSWEGDAWVAQSVKRLTSGQVMISRFMASSTTSGSTLTTQSLLGILSLPLSLPLPCSLFFSLKILFLNLLIIFERGQAREWQRERGWQRIGSSLHADNRETAPCGAQTQDPWDHNLSPSGMLNQLSHPGAPINKHFQKKKHKNYDNFSMINLHIPPDGIWIRQHPVQSKGEHPTHIIHHMSECDMSEHVLTRLMSQCVPHTDTSTLLHELWSFDALIQDDPLWLQVWSWWSLAQGIDKVIILVLLMYYNHVNHKSLNR